MSNTIINSEVHGAYFEAIKEDVKKHIYIYGNLEPEKIRWLLTSYSRRKTTVLSP